MFPIYNLGLHLNKKFAEIWVNKFKNCVLERINSISDLELKDINKDVIVNIVSNLRSLLLDVDRTVNSY